MVAIQFDQLALRRLENGDYCRVTKERYGTRIIIELGTADHDDEGNAIFVWQWGIELGMSGLADLLHDLGIATRALCQTADAIIAQQRDKIVDLVEIVDAERSKHIGDQDQALPQGAPAQGFGRAGWQAYPGEEACFGGEILGPGGA